MTEHVGGSRLEDTLSPRQLVVEAIPLHSFCSLAQAVEPQSISLFSCHETPLLSNHISIGNSCMLLVQEKSWRLHLHVGLV